MCVSGGGAFACVQVWIGLGGRWKVEGEEEEEEGAIGSRRRNSVPSVELNKCDTSMPATATSATCERSA